MFWEGVSIMLDLFVLWLGSALLFLIPLGVGLGLWHAAQKGASAVKECFVSVFTMHKPDEDEVDALLVYATETTAKDSEQERIQDDNTEVTQKKGSKKHGNT